MIIYFLKCQTSCSFTFIDPHCLPTIDPEDSPRIHRGTHQPIYKHPFYFLPFQPSPPFNPRHLSPSPHPIHHLFPRHLSRSPHPTHHIPLTTSTSPHPTYHLFPSHLSLATSHSPHPLAVSTLSPHPAHHLPPPHPPHHLPLATFPSPPSPSPFQPSAPFPFTTSP